MLRGISRALTSKARGVSQRSIARAIGVRPSAVNRWRNDLVEPKYMAAVRLLHLVEQQQRTQPDHTNVKITEMATGFPGYNSLPAGQRRVLSPIKKDV